MKFVWFILFLCIATGCDREHEERPIRIAVSLAGIDGLTTTQQIEGMNNAAENVNVEITWRTAFSDHELQKRQIDTLLAKDHDIIAVEVADPRKSDEIFGKIRQSGLPVIGFNRLAPGFQYDLIVSPEYKTIGRELTEILIEKYDDGKKNVLLLHGLLLNDQESLFMEGFLNAIETADHFAITMVEAFHVENGLTGRIEIPDFNKELLRITDIVVTTNWYNAFSAAVGLLNTDQEGIEHRSPVIAGFGDREVLTTIGYDNLLLIDLQPYTAGIRLIDSAAGFVRGEFRHYDGPVIRIGEHLMPVVYTPHSFGFAADAPTDN